MILSGMGRRRAEGGERGGLPEALVIEAYRRRRGLSYILLYDIISVVLQTTAKNAVPLRGMRVAGGTPALRSEDPYQ